MENPQETNLKVFNTAKVFSEQILFPLMADFKKFQRQSNYGWDNLKDSLDIPEEIRDIQRFNGIKAMAETCSDLIKAITSTVRIKNNKEEIEELEKLLKTIGRVISLFYENKERFFTTTQKGLVQVEILKREYFDKIRKIIDSCYINTEILMTRNKLLFADSNDEYKSDAELMEQIKKEYSGE